MSGTLSEIELITSSPFTFAGNPDKALKEYLRVGYHLEPNVLSHEACDDLVQASLDLEGAKTNHFRPYMMPHRQKDIYLHAMKNPRIVDVLAQLVGGPVSGLQSEFFYGRPGTRGFSLHQDNFFVQAPMGAFASAWVALTDTYPEKGGLIVYPYTHREGELPVEKTHLEIDASQDPNANNEQTVVPKQYRPAHVAVPKGAALFIHGHLVHGSNANVTEDWRYVLLLTYIRRGEKFRAGRYAQREEVIV